MARIVYLAIIITFSLLGFNAPKALSDEKNQIDNVTEEKIYLDFIKQLHQFHTPSTISIQNNQKIFLDALEDFISANKKNKILKNLTSQFHKLNFNFDLIESLRLELIKLELEQISKLPSPLLVKINQEIKKKTPHKRLLYLLAAKEQILLKKGHQSLIQLAKQHREYENLFKTPAPTQSLIRDLFYFRPNLDTYRNGEYKQSVRLFMFCRKNRLYPCLMAMPKNNQEVWTHPALASAITDLPSYERNGHTPSGLFTIDSVMPLADQQVSFGQYRRLILNFIPASKEDQLTKELLPESSRNHDWWRPAEVARDIGRSLLRIHGSGKLNTDPSTPHFPFLRTHGCISQRENTYSGIEYRDQRNLLDSLMDELGLDPIYENEVQIKGILYLIEINDKNQSVNLDDLRELGITL